MNLLVRQLILTKTPMSPLVARCILTSVCILKEKKTTSSLTYSHIPYIKVYNL